MNKKLILLIFLTLFISWQCICPVKIRESGSRKIVIFENENVQFAPDKYKEVESGDMIHLSNGRIILKKITIPEYKRNFKNIIKIKLTSDGDRWDKSGSCFIIPNESLINFINIQKEENEFPDVSEKLEDLKGIIGNNEYKPVIELMRFMTPFGVGAFSDKMELRKPVYIPFWEKEVNWEQDISELDSRFVGDIWIGVWIDTWTSEGYKISLELDLIESDNEYKKRNLTHIEPILNTVPYINGQKLPNVFARNDIDVEVLIPKNASNIRLKYITTGHGGHSGGDEFVKKENIIMLDGKEIYNFIPWRDDCASFRRFNPGSGVWVMKDTTEYINFETWKYEVKEIEERIASSDLSRSNWCPGSQVIPEDILLTNISPGKHKFTFCIPEAQPAEGDKLNHWLVSAYLVWDEMTK